MAAAISVEQLSKTYSEGILFRKHHKALQNVSLDVRNGEVFGLLGPNGAGKTTLIKILLGILHPSKGKATVLDMEAGSKAARRKIGYLPENLIFPRHHTGRSALYFYGRLSELNDSQIAKREREVFDMVDLTGREHEPVRRYSKGMRQRLGLAQALLHDPELLIMDEPTDGLDPMGRSQIRDLLARLKERGKTVFLNSHILQEVELICDRVAIMALGQLRGQGPIDELIRQNPLAQQGAVILEVQCPEGIAMTTQALGDEAASIVLLSETERVYRVELSLPDQLSLDRLIDRLRNQQISILAVERFRPSLEQVFMSFVGSVPPHLR
ncbi:MAG: ABC transporter ATP-binding protein [Pirellula sp.]|nr:ABC transporter ATP-binding protein [Pirellula sp.]